MFLLLAYQANSFSNFWDFKQDNRWKFSFSLSELQMLMLLPTWPSHTWEVTLQQAIAYLHKFLYALILLMVNKYQPYEIGTP